MMGTMAFGQTNVLSQNAVGYVKKTVDQGTLALMSYDFIDLAGNPVTVASLMGDQVPVGTAVSVWDRAGSSYVTVQKGARGWPGTTPELMRGDGFFVQIPDNSAESAYDIYMLGEVPGANNNADETTVPNVELDAVGYPYPAAVLFTATTAAASAESGDAVSTWDQANQQYATFVKGARGWPGGALNLVIEPGEAFWLDLDTNIDWTEPKPYAWP